MAMDMAIMPQVIHLISSHTTQLNGMIQTVMITVIMQTATIQICGQLTQLNGPTLMVMAMEIIQLELLEMHSHSIQPNGQMLTVMDLVIIQHRQVIQTHSLMMELNGRIQMVMVMAITKVDLMLIDL